MALRAGVRGRTIQAILALGVFLMGIAYLSASFSPRQPQTVALDVGFSFLRVTLVLLGLFWVQELIAKEIERRTVVFAVSYPVSRSAYLLGRACGIALLLGVAAMGLAVLLWVAATIAGISYAQQHAIQLGGAFWIATAGIWLDAVIVCAFGVFLATISTVSVLPLALGICFAVAGKGLGLARSYVLAGADGDDRLVAQMAPWLEIIRWLLPDLSRLDWRAWPMYGLEPDPAAMAWAVAAVVAYGALMLSLACRSFGQREFS